jgi:RNA polymerase sigma-70 factor (ECF subfamily)
MEAKSTLTAKTEIISQSPSSEVELVAKLQKGDKEAIKAIFNANFEKLYSFVFHEVEQNQTVAEDMVQDTFISAIKSASKFKGNSRIYTWLVGIAHHKIADYYRHAKREQRYDNKNSDGKDPEQLDLAIDKTPASNIAESTENRMMVEQALNSLPAEYREIIILKYVEEFPVDEIARVLNRSPKSVEGILSRARKAIKDMIKDQNEG